MHTPHLPPAPASCPVCQGTSKPNTFFHQLTEFLPFCPAVPSDQEPQGHTVWSCPFLVPSSLPVARPPGLWCAPRAAWLRPALTTPCSCDSLWCPLSICFLLTGWQIHWCIIAYSLSLSGWWLVFSIYFVNRWIKEKWKICKVRHKSHLLYSYNDPL